MLPIDTTNYIHFIIERIQRIDLKGNVRHSFYQVYLHDDYGLFHLDQDFQSVDSLEKYIEGKTMKDIILEIEKPYRGSEHFIREVLSADGMYICGQWVNASELNNVLNINIQQMYAHR